VLQVFRSSLIPRSEGLPEELERGKEMQNPSLFWSSVSAILGFRPQVGQRDWNSTSLGLTIHALRLSTQRIDDFLLRGLWSRHATLPPSFRNSSQVAGISRVCTESSNNSDIFRYIHFLPLMRRTISLRIAWALPRLW
jgi:hypothetical protein